MVKLYGVPQSLGEWARSVWSSPLASVLWKGGLTLLILFVVVGLASIWTLVGGIIAGFVITLIAGDEIRATISDTYERRWTRVDLSGLWPFAVALLAVTVLVTVPTPAAADDRVTLPEERLAQHSDIFEQRGNVTATYDRVAASVTLAEAPSDVGVSSWRYTATGYSYLRVDYDEGVARTLRIEVPGDMVRPRAKDGLDAIHSDAVANIRDVDGTTVLSLRVDGQTDAVFPLSKAAGFVFDVRGGIKTRFANQTGLPIPSLSSNGKWTVVNDSLQPQTTYRIDHGDVNAPVAIQYDAGTVSDPRWVPVAPCDTENTPICELGPASNDTQTTVLVDDSDPPRMRYQVDAGLVARFHAAFNDALEIPGRVQRGIEDLLSGVPFL